MPASVTALPASAEALRKLLDAGHRLTKAEAAARLALDPRSVTRLVGALRQAGVPVADEPDPADGRRKRFFLAAEHQRRGLHLDSLDETEILALTVAAEAARAALHATPLQAPLASAFRALLEAAHEAGDGLGTLTFDPDDEPTHWHFGSHVTPPDPAVFAPVRQAITDGLRIRIDYTDKRGRFSPGREVSPLGFGLVRGSWLLVTYCHVRQALRDFALPSVSHVHVLSGAVHVPRVLAGRLFRAAVRGTGRRRARRGAAADPADRAVYFQRRRYHPSQALAEQPDGRPWRRTRSPEARPSTRCVPSSPVGART